MKLNLARVLALTALVLTGCAMPPAGPSVPASAYSVEIPCPEPKPGYVCHLTQIKP